LAETLDGAGIECHLLPLAIPYHTPLVRNALTVDHADVRQLPIAPPAVKAWSCSSASPYPDDIEELRALCTGLFEKTIQLRSTVEKAYEDGARIFVELGPRGSLTPLIQETLAEKPHLAVACDLTNRSSITQLNHLLGALFC